MNSTPTNPTPLAKIKWFAAMSFTEVLNLPFNKPLYVCDTYRFNGQISALEIFEELTRDPYAALLDLCGISFRRQVGFKFCNSGQVAR